MPRAATEATVAPATSPRRTWSVPTLRELPKLTDLTLASAIGGGGGTGGGGSTVFGILLAAGLVAGLAGCVGDRMDESEAPRHPTLTRAVACVADVPERTVSCDGGPLASGPNTEIMGGGGTFIALRSTNVAYNSGTEEFSFDVSVQNLGHQIIGTDDGITVTGIDVFFESAPVVTSGTGTITVLNATGTATFDAAGQDYFHYATLLDNQDESAPQPWILSIPTTVTTFAFTVMVSADVPDVGGVLLWERVRPTTAQFGTMLDIAANGASDAMAVGAAGLVMLKTSQGWKALPDQITGNWIGVEAIGNGEYIGATDAGGIYLYSRRVWRLIHQVGWTISTLTASSSQNILVAGTSHVAWWGSNGTAADAALSSGAGYFVTSAWYGGGNEWIVGSTAGNKWTGNFLAPVGTVLGNCCNLFTTIAAGGSNNPLGAFVGGGSAFLKDFISGIFFVGPATDSTIDAVTYGAGGVGAFFWRATRSNTTGDTELSSFNGSWTTRATVTGTVRQIIDDQNGGIYLVTSAGIKRWNGSAVVDEFVQLAAPSLNSIWGNDTTAIVGFQQGVYQYVDGAWTTRDPGNGNVSYTAMGGTGPDDQYAGWYAGLAHWDGVSWTTDPTLAGKTVAGLYAVPGMVSVLEGKNVWLNTGGGFIQATDPDLPNDSLMATWASSPNDVWVVAKGFKIAHYDGSDWTSSYPVGAGAGTPSITGSGPADIWAVHKDSLHHWNGTAWSADLAPPACGYIYSPVSTSPGHVLFLCSTDASVRFRTLAGHGTINTPGGVFPWYMAGGSGASLWAIGSDNFILRGRR